MLLTAANFTFKRNSKIPKGQTEIVNSEIRQDHGQQNETKDKHRTHNTTLKTNGFLTRVNLCYINTVNFAMANKWVLFNVL